MFGVRGGGYIAVSACCLGCAAGAYGVGSEIKVWGRRGGGKYEELGEDEEEEEEEVVSVTKGFMLSLHVPMLRQLLPIHFLVGFSEGVLINLISPNFTSRVVGVGTAVKTAVGAGVAWKLGGGGGGKVLKYLEEMKGGEGERQIEGEGVGMIEVVSTEGASTEGVSTEDVSTEGVSTEDVSTAVVSPSVESPPSPPSRSVPTSSSSSSSEVPVLSLLNLLVFLPLLPLSLLILLLPAGEGETQTNYYLALSYPMSGVSYGLWSCFTSGASVGLASGGAAGAFGEAKFTEGLGAAVGLSGVGGKWGMVGTWIGTAAMHWGMRRENARGGGVFF
jgi:hypothetical protein